MTNFRSGTLDFMRLTIRHATCYDYSSGSRYAVQRLRLTPRGTPSQQVLSWRIDAPGIKDAPTYLDGFGNVVHLLAHMEPHDQIEITASGSVETTETGGVVGRTDEVANPALFLRATPLTDLSPGIASMVRELKYNVGDGDPIALLHAVLSEISDRVAYVTEATDSDTAASAAFDAGEGVCQDHAHIFIAAARALDIPARYVTGYLLVESEGPHAAHHAWAEAHLPDLGWVGFDPANNVCPTEHYVRLGCGLDAVSAAPVTGTRRGGGSESLTVNVSVVQSQQQA